MTRAESTRERLAATALDLFSERGYEATSVADVARAAGVSHMTFFRHFPTKESAVVGDPFDPLIAHAVSAQPAADPPLARAVHGLVAALGHEAARESLGSAAFRRRIALVAATPALRAASFAATQETQDAVVEALRTGDVEDAVARAAAGALLGAATSLLLGWATSDGPTDAATVLRHGLLALLGETP